MLPLQPSDSLMQFTLQRLPEVRRIFPNCGMFVSGMANTARKNYPDLMVPLCNPRFGIVLVTEAGSS